MKLLPLAIVLSTLICLCSHAHAQITLSKISDMDFGLLSYDTSHRGDLLLGTNGSVTLSGATGLVHDGGSGAGNVLIAGTPLDVIEIKCTVTGRMTEPGGKRVSLRDLEVSLNTGTTPGAANACNNIRKNSAPAIVHDLATDPNPSVLMGATARVSNNSLVSETYATSNGGGTAITLRVIFQ